MAQLAGSFFERGVQGFPLGELRRVEWGGAQGVRSTCHSRAVGMPLIQWTRSAWVRAAVLGWQVAPVIPSWTRLLCMAGRGASRWSFWVWRW